MPNNYEFDYQREIDYERACEFYAAHSCECCPNESYFEDGPFTHGDGLCIDRSNIDHAKGTIDIYWTAKGAFHPECWGLE